MEGKRGEGVRIALAVVVFAWAQSAPSRSADDVEFNRDVRPILANHCFQCHGPDENTREAGLRLDAREYATKITESGVAAVAPGAPSESELVRRIFADDDSERMPPASANKDLSESQKRTLSRWIAQGAPYEPHWAFVPPRKAAPPDLRDTRWPNHPIDAFILDRLEKAGLSPSPPADAHALARRVSLDLVGVPPDPDEADAFASDPAPDAYERWVDRLLASPDYGERWARKWLDLARYADTNGYEKDRVRSIWPYRDWVIEAINADMPFDEFTVKQLAGDMAPDASLADRIATGFHRNTMINEEGGVDPLEYRFHALVDRVHTTGATWLGLTLGCAQCHTHKFDPITQTDYYRFMAFLDNADEPTISVPDPAVERARGEIDARIAKLESELADRFPPDGALQWTLVRPATAASRNGADLRILDDGSIYAAGDRPETDVYTVTVESDLSDLAAVRIEALTDSGLPKTGPGRADNGNFVLTEIRMERSPRDGSHGPEEVDFYAAEADFEQDGFPAAAALDGGEKTGWAVAGADGWNVERSVSLRISSPLEAGAPARWTIRLHQEYGGRHTLGRFRIRFGTFVDDGRSTAQRRRDRLERRFSEWLAETSAKAVQWRVLRPSEATSNLPYLTVLDDDSILAGGDQSKSDRYDLRFPTNLSEVRAFRLEAIPDERLPASGPGRVYYEGPSGDFNLSDFRVVAGGRLVRFVRAVESYADGKNKAAFAIDDNLQTGWSINGGQGRPHTAIFECDPPADPKGLIEATLLFEKYYAAGLGRFRISVTDQPRPDPSLVLPPEVEEMLAADERSPEQLDRLRRYFLATAPELERPRREIDALRKQRPDHPTTLAFEERPPGFERTTHRRRRGEFLQPEEAVSPGVPEALPPIDEREPKNRLALARWLVSGEHPLTGRVTMNRQWAALFGRGIVRTVEDFGLQGEPPSHPEVLDWLAVELVDQQWSMKRMHRMLVGTATYRQSARVSQELLAKDPENRLLARGPRVRLDAEAIRDSLLAASGLLTKKIGGPSVFPPQPPGVTSEGTYGPLEWKTSEGEDRYRRGLYTFSKRTAPYAMFAVFDAPSGESCVARREISNSPLQALTALNDEVFVEAARALGSWAAGLDGDDVNRARRLIRRCLVRPAGEEEAAEAAEFHRTQRDRMLRGELDAAAIAGSAEGDAIERAAWTLLARAILNLDEMVVNQ
jgi:mono/diheme cytochrome c family protein